MPSCRPGSTRTCSASPNARTAPSNSTPASGRCIATSAMPPPATPAGRAPAACGSSWPRTEASSRATQPQPRRPPTAHIDQIGTASTAATNRSPPTGPRRTSRPPSQTRPPQGRRPGSDRSEPPAGGAPPPASAPGPGGGAAALQRPPRRASTGRLPTPSSPRSKRGEGGVAHARGVMVSEVDLVLESFDDRLLEVALVEPAAGAETAGAEDVDLHQL